MRTVRPMLGAVVMLSLPGQAPADRVYTGAKRACVERICNEAVAAAAGVLDSAAAIAGLDTRVGELEGDVGALEEGVSAPDAERTASRPVRSGCLAPRSGWSACRATSLRGCCDAGVRARAGGALGGRDPSPGHVGAWSRMNQDPTPEAQHERGARMGPRSDRQGTSTATVLATCGRCARSQLHGSCTSGVVTRRQPPARMERLMTWRW